MIPVCLYLQVISDFLVVRKLCLLTSWFFTLEMYPQNLIRSLSLPWSQHLPLIGKPAEVSFNNANRLKCVHSDKHPLTNQHIRENVQGKGETTIKKSNFKRREKAQAENWLLILWGEKMHFGLFSMHIFEIFIIEFPYTFDLRNYLLNCGNDSLRGMILMYYFLNGLCHRIGVQWKERRTKAMLLMWPWKV